MEVATRSRRGPRINLRLPVLMLWGTECEAHLEHTFTITLSWHGCAVYSHNFFPPRSSVQVKRGGKIIDGRVVYCLKDESNNMVEVGVEFEEDGRKFWQLPVWVD